MRCIWGRTGRPVMVTHVQDVCDAQGLHEVGTGGVVKRSDEQKAGHNLGGEGRGGTHVSRVHHVAAHAAALAPHVLWRETREAGSEIDQRSGRRGTRPAQWHTHLLASPTHIMVVLADGAGLLAFSLLFSHFRWFLWRTSSLEGANMHELGGTIANCNEIV